MKAEDRAEFVSLLNLCYSTLQRPLPTADGMKLWENLLRPYSLEQVSAAFYRHMQVSEFAPKPANIIAFLKPAEGTDGRPDADEAWAISFRANDESETIVWTEECSQAFHRASVIEDETGRRMAFKSTYTRIVATARERGDAVRWVKSLGHDVQRRDVVLAQAVRDGRLTLNDVRVVAPHVLEDLREEQAIAEVQKLTSKLTSRLPS